MRTEILTSRLTSMLAVALLLGACRETAAPVGSGVERARFSLAQADGAHGAIAFHGNRTGNIRDLRDERGREPRERRSTS